MSITVVPADDEPLVVAGITAILGNDGAIDVVATAEDGRGALDAVRRHRPRIALLDIRMPRLTGTDVVATVTKDPALTQVLCHAHHLRRRHPPRRGCRRRRLRLPAQEHAPGSDPGRSFTRQQLAKCRSLPP